MHSRIFPCEPCPTFKVMQSGIPQMRQWEKDGIKYRSIVTSDSSDIAHETLTIIKKKL